MVDWLMDRCQDAMVTEELDPGLFGYQASAGSCATSGSGEFIELLRSAWVAGGVRCGSRCRQAGRV